MPSTSLNLLIYFYNPYLFIGFMTKLHRFITDLEILTQADIFLGSHSNMYTVVTALRIARDVNKYNLFKNHSCVLLSSSTQEALRPSTVHCDGKLPVFSMLLFFSILLFSALRILPVSFFIRSHTPVSIFCF